MWFLTMIARALDKEVPSARQVRAQEGLDRKARFNLLATNGHVGATSESYESKAAAMRGIQSVRRLAADAVLDDQTAPRSGPVSNTPTKRAATRRTKADGAAAVG